jgi:hypothetical protein
MPTSIYRMFLADLHGAWGAHDWHAHRTTLIVLDLHFTGRAS